MSKKIEVLVAQPIDEELAEKLRQVSDRLNIEFKPVSQAGDISEETWEKTEVLYTFRVLPRPNQAPNLRWIQYHLAGADKLLEDPLSQKEGLTITTMSGANAPPVAEHAIGLALSLSRKIPELVVQQGRTEWITKTPDGYHPKDLQGSTVGIVGYGSVGRQIARLLHNFGVTILAAKRNAMQPQDTGYSPEGTGDPEGNFFTRLYPVQALGSMLGECDYVFVTLPLTAETEGLIGAKELGSLKPNCYLVDVSRGGVVDQQALIKALEDKTLAGAAIDVFPEEPLPENSPFWTLPNVLISPHVAGFSENYDRRAIELFSENLQRYLQEEPLYNRINLRRGY